MQIYINGKEIDLYKDEKVAITLQINDLGELDKANTSYTNSFKIPRTATNTRVLENLGAPGNTSRVMYTLNNVTILEDSLPILVNGFAVISDTYPDYYSIYVYGAEKTFFEKIKNVTVQDCYPSVNLPWNSGTLAARTHSTSNFCFPIAQYNSDTRHSGSLQVSGAIWSRTKVLATTPVFYVKHLFESIFNYFGYELDYPIVNDTVYSKLVVPAEKGVSHFSVQYGDLFNLKNCVTTIAVSDFIKEIMYRWGLTIQVDEFNKKVSFSKLDTMLVESQALDWTSKVVEIKNEKYNLDGYAQNNLFAYDGDDEADENWPTAPANELSGSFDLNIETLDGQKTVVSSQAQKPIWWGYLETNTYAKGCIFYYNYTPMRYYYMLDIAENKANEDGSVSTKENSFQFMYMKTVEAAIQIFESPDGSNNSQSASAPCFVVTKDFLSWQYYIDTYYTNIIHLLTDQTIIKVNMFLNVLDIYNFNFFSRIYLEQYGSYFYVNKINNWQNNKVVEVELIKIPPISTAGGGYYASSARMIGTL